MSGGTILVAGLVTFGITFIALYVWGLFAAPLIIVPAVLIVLSLVGRWSQ